MGIFRNNTDETLVVNIFVLLSGLSYLNPMLQGREHEFRGISYLTSTRVVWYGALTALTVISCGCFMMKNMTSFFISKKLV